MNSKIILVIAIVSIIVVGLTSLAYGQELNTTQLNQNDIDALRRSEKGLQEQKQSLNKLINYCYEHADRPNPIQDLVDKGLLFPYFKNFTCIDFNDMISDIDNRITVVQTEINKLEELNWLKK
jgi:hypothetical protein